MFQVIGEGRSFGYRLEALKQRGAALRVALPTNCEFLSTLHGRQPVGVPETAGASLSSR